MPPGKSRKTPKTPTETQPDNIWTHLDELRLRLTRSFIALFIASLLGFLLAESVLRWMLLPYTSLLGMQAGGAQRIEVIGPTEGVSIYLQISLGLGFAFILPYLVWELLGFVMPGLEERERKWVWLIVPSASLLFLLGVSFSWWVLIPSAIRFLHGFLSSVIESRWTAREYVPFVVQLTIWMGVAFELPLVTFFLAAIGVVTPQLLLKGWRIAVVVCAVVAAAITPTVDPVNMLLVWMPLLGLYAVSVLLSYIPYAARKRNAGES